MLFRFLHNLLTFLAQGLGFAVETFLVMLGIMALWNGYITQKMDFPTMGFFVALIGALVLRVVIWMPVFAKLSKAEADDDVAEKVDLGDRPASLARPVKDIAPVKPLPSKLTAGGS